MGGIFGFSGVLGVLLDWFCWVLCLHWVRMCVSPLSSGWDVCLSSSPPYSHVGVLYVCLFAEHIRVFYKCDQFGYPFEGSCQSPPLGMSPISQYVSVAVVVLAFQCDVLAGLDCGSTWAFDCLGWDKAFVVLSGVCMSHPALDQPAECFLVCSEKSFHGFKCQGDDVCWLEPCSRWVRCVRPSVSPCLQHFTFV